jgi:hypothetical protein
VHQLPHARITSLRESGSFAQPGNMHRCPKCGGELESATGDCPRCDRQPKRSPDVASAADWTTPRAAKSQRSARRWLIAAAVAIVAALVLVGMRQQQDAARRLQSRNNLKHIGMALQNYHATYDSFPAGVTLGENGQPYQSWLTVLLPFLDANPFVVMMDRTHPWDDPRNVPISRMPIPVYLIPGVAATTDDRGFALSHYTGHSQVFDHARPMTISELPLGSSNTVLAGEVAEGFEPWARPVAGRDASAALNSGPNSFGRCTGDGAFLLMADGSVRFVANAAKPTAANPNRRGIDGDRKTPVYSNVSQKLRPSLPTLVQMDPEGKTVAIWAPNPWHWKEDVRLTNNDMKLLASLNDLEAVFIRGPDVTDDGLESFADLRKLQVLEIKYAPVSDQAVRHLAQLTQLKVLQLRDTDVTADGLARLKDALPNCDVSVSGSFAK